MLAVALACGFGPAAVAAETVEVRAAAHPGFGRLVLDWPSPVAVETRHAADRLILRFARPFAADLSSAAARLADYLAGLMPGTDPRELVIRLRPEVEPAFDVYDDRLVVLDFTRPAGAAAVELRTGVHDGFVRLVFDWKAPVGFEAATDGRRVRIMFDRRGRIDTARIERALTAWLDRASAATRVGGSEVRLDLKAGVIARVFGVEKRRVVVDLSRRAGAAGDGDGRSTPAVTPPPSSPPAPAAAPATEPAVRMLPALGPPAPPPDPALRVLPAQVDGRPALDFVWNRPVPAAVLTRAGHLWVVFAASGVVALPESVPELLGPGEPVPADGGSAIRFPLRAPTGLRVERAGASWRVVFDAAAAPPRALPAQRLPEPPRLRFAEADGAGVVRVTDPEVGDRLAFWPLATPGVGQPEGRRWVDFELLSSTQGLAWRVLNDRAGAEVVEGALELSAPSGLAVPASAPQTATVPPVGRVDRPPPVPPDRTAEHSAEAGVGEPGAPEAAIDLGAPDAPAPGPDAFAVAGRGISAAPFLDLGRWALADGRTLRARRVALQRRIKDLPAAERLAARLDLARLFLAQGLAAETLAVLAVIEDPGGPDAGENDPFGDADLREREALAHQALAGAAQLLMGRLDEAAVALGAPAFDRDPEIALWRAALAAAREDWQEAARAFGRADGTLEAYPSRLQLRLGLPAARVAIETGNQDLTRLLLARLKALDLHPTDRARVRFLEGLAAARRGAAADAERIWGALAASSDARTRVVAAYAHHRLLAETGRLGPSEALARLAAARPLWYGHDREAAMLDGLAELYLRSGDPARAVRTWHEALTRFPKMPGAERIADSLRGTFTAALQGDEASRIGAVRAYALYRDFPELVPKGRAGHRIRRQLAARLTGLDLIEPAARLLEELIGEQGDEGKASASATIGRAEDGASLAEVWLRGPRPAMALDALERTAVPDRLPVSLRSRRDLLRARALSALDRPAEALALLAGKSSAAARRLRADIFWQQEDWPRLVDDLEALLAGRVEPDKPLAEADQDLVVRLALAYARLGRLSALEHLRRRFAAAMQGQRREAAFLIATLTPGRPFEPEAVLATAEEHLDRARHLLDADPSLH